MTLNLSNDKFSNIYVIYTCHKEGTKYLNRVKQFRKDQGLSQLKLAQKIGVARQTINLIENNKYNPSLELCINLAKALNTDLNSLFWEQHTDERNN